MADSPLEAYKEHIERWISEGKNNIEIVKLLANDLVFTSESSIRRFISRHSDLSHIKASISSAQESLKEHEKLHETPLGQPGISITNDVASITTLTHASGANISPEEVLIEHGLDPEQWDVISYTSNRWEGPTKTGKQQLEQSKLTAKRKKHLLITPAVVREPGPVFKPKPVKKSGSQVTLILPDPHAPLHEKPLVEASIALIHHIKPNRIICLGDANDNSPFKRHKKNLRIDCEPQECIDATYELLLGWRQAAPNAEFILLPGNHDFWLKDRVLEMIPGLANLRIAGTDKILIGMELILRLDELGIKYIEAGGEYHDATFLIEPDLIGMHGTKTGQYGGAVSEFSNWEGASVIQGHDHKGAIVLMTKRLADGTEVQRVAMSAGTMARRDLGYDPKRNVNQCFFTITTHEDGQWHPEMAIFNPQTQTTLWRDWSYTAS